MSLIEFLAIIAGAVYLAGWVFLLYCFQRIVVDDLIKESKRSKRKKVNGTSPTSPPSAGFFTPRRPV